MPAKGTQSKSSRTAATSPSEFAPGVFVGGWEDALKFTGAKFCVLDEAPKEMPSATHIPIYDESTDRANPANLDRLAERMRGARAKGQPVLVFCHQGMYRSPLGAAWFLHRVEGVPLDEASERIQAVRPKAKLAANWVGNYQEIVRA